MDPADSHRPEDRSATTDRTVSSHPGDSPPVLSNIGRYRVLSILGQGGMGTVYEAEQESPRRRVAVKVVRGGTLVDDVELRMFQREAETLGRLKHPGIAAIYESGRTQDGQHFFAMELVSGTTLDEHLRRRAGTGPTDATELRRRLRLFLRIVQAVQYAHQRGVIHRDLKPSNIIVAEDGTGDGSRRSAEADPAIKVLDFGLARITDADVKATTISEIGAVKGTLPYMSPEQARGRSEELDVRTDVYSLGVILYEMMFGMRPYDVGSGSLLEAVRVICEEKPAPQGTRSGRNRAIDPDVETICLKALEKDPERRYAGAAELGDDVERYLTNQPILARPPSRIYQLRKMVARNRVPVTLACSLFVLAVGSAIALGFLWQGQREERARAEGEADRTRRVNSFLTDMLESVSPEETRGKEVTVRYLLDGAARRADAELGDDPDIHSEIQQTLGRTYRALALYDDADSLLRPALETRRQLFGETSVEASSALNDLALLRWDTGELGEAETLYREAVAIDRGEEREERVATDLNNLGGLLREAGRFDDAEAVLREALEKKQALYGKEHTEVAEGLHNLATVLHQEGDLDEAVPLMREALAMTIRLRGEDHPDVNAARSNLAAMLRDQGHTDEAETLQREALETARRVYGDRHPTVGTAWHQLGWALFQNDRKEEAVGAFRHALDIRREALGPDHPYVAMSLGALARGMQETGDPAGARPVYEEALALQRKLIGSQHPETLITMVSLSRCLMDLGETAKAERLLGEAAGTAAGVLGDHPINGYARSLHGRTLFDLGRLAEAEPELLEARRILELVYGEDHPRTRDAAASLAELYDRTARRAEAETWRARAGGGGAEE